MIDTEHEGEDTETSQQNDGEQKPVSSPRGETDSVGRNRESDDNASEVAIEQTASEKANNGHDSAAAENEHDTANAVDIVQALEGTMRDYFDRLGVSQEHAMDWRDTCEGSAHSIHEAERLLRECINRNKSDDNGDENSELRFYRENGVVRDVPSQFGILADKLEQRIRRTMKRNKTARHKREQSSYDYTKHCMRTVQERWT
ncbi:hypothetical protein FOL47_008169 [Perkinsus chesapeaki]|uniref:Uncharacterized protein n=1 Tax=Perkinsus chesapeaki TaxID=330153 RepID=A0A7J6MU89_PERCH|nr:hypothetical protein FOL47_008169 [Perkinsus chesapeaki]